MLLKITLTLLTLAYAAASNPLEIENQTSDPNYENVNPKFTYGYKIVSEHGSQEKQEQRVGDYALGRYNVQGADSIQNVEYLADEWGFHPLIHYSNVGPHSISSTRIAYGTEAVNALQNSQKSQGETILIQNQNDENPNINEETPQNEETKNNTIFYPTPVPIQEDRNSPQESQNIVYLQQEAPDILYEREAGVYYLPNQNFMYTPPTPSMYLLHLSNNVNIQYDDSNQLKESRENRGKSNDEKTNYGRNINVKLDTKLGTQTTDKVRLPKFVDSTKSLVSGEDVLGINSYFNTQPKTTLKKDASTINLHRDPIVVLDENNLDENKETVYSTTKSTIETVNTETNPSTLVTARPVSNIFLAPITAGLRLSSSEEPTQDKVIVEVEKSLPLYLGSFNANQKNSLPVPQALVQHEPIMVQNSIKTEPKGEGTFYVPQIFLLPEAQDSKLEKDLLRHASQQYVSEQQIRYFNPEQVAQEQIVTGRPYSQQTGSVEQYSQKTTPQDSSLRYLPKPQAYSQSENIETHENSHSAFENPVSHYFTIDHHSKSEPQFSQQLGTHKETSNNNHFSPQYTKDLETKLEHQFGTHKEISSNNHYSAKYTKDKETKSEPQFLQHFGTHKELSSNIHTNTGEIIKDSQFMQGDFKHDTSKVPYVTKLIPQKPHSLIRYKYKNARPVSVPKSHHHYPSHMRYKNIYQGYAPSYPQNYEQSKPTVRPQRINYNPYIGMPFYNIHPSSSIKAHPTTSLHKNPPQSYSFYNHDQQYLPSKRTARQSFGSNLRIEYGFMPPFLPSVEIDEQGRPLDKNDE